MNSHFARRRQDGAIPVFGKNCDVTLKIRKNVGFKCRIETQPVNLQGFAMANKAEPRRIWGRVLGRLLAIVGRVS